MFCLIPASRDYTFTNPSTGELLEAEAQGAHAFPNGHLITVPSFVKDGDFALMLDVATTNGSNPSTVSITGWTDESNITGTGAGVDTHIRSMLRSTIFDADDESDVLTGLNGGEIERKIMMIIRPTRRIKSYTVTVSGHQITSGNPTAITVNPTSGQAPIITFGLAASRGLINPFTWTSITPNWTSSLDSATIAGFKYFPNKASLTSGSVDTDDEGDFNVLCAGYVSFVF